MRGCEGCYLSSAVGGKTAATTRKEVVEGVDDGGEEDKYAEDTRGGRAVRGSTSTCAMPLTRLFGLAFSFFGMSHFLIHVLSG